MALGWLKGGQAPGEPPGFARASVPAEPTGDEAATSAAAMLASPAAPPAVGWHGGPGAPAGLPPRRPLRERVRARLLLAPVTTIMVAAAAVLVLAWVQKSPCLHTTPGWSHGVPYRYACYSDVIPLYGAEGLEEAGTFPYVHSWIDSKGTPQQHVRYMEYPVLTGLFMWMNAQFTHAYDAVAKAVVYVPSTLPGIVFFNFCALFAAVFWLLSVRFLTRMTPSRRWDAAIAALSPIVVVQAFTNFDMLAVALATGAMLAWARRRHTLAGVLIGLGTAAKLYPVLLLVPLFALCWRAGKLSEWRRSGSAALISWVAVNAPIELISPRGWLEFIHLNSIRGADPDSLYNVVMQYTGWGGFDGPLPFNHAPTLLNGFIALLLAACLLAIVLVALSAPRRPRVAQLAFLAVAAFLVTNKVWSPQYSLWLIPLAVLALPRWKPLFAWMAIEAWLWVARMYFYLPTSEGGWGQGPFLITVMVRDAAVLGLCALVLREIYQPARDLVRQSGDDDPAGGVLERAPDVFVLGRKRPAILSGAGTS